MNISEERIEIDIVDIIISALKKWKIILLIAIVTAGLFALYAIHKNSNASKTFEDEKAILGSSLSDDKRVDVEGAAETILNYQSMYKDQLYYNKNSILQNLDPYSIDTAKLYYFIDNNYSITYPTIESQNNISALVSSYSAFAKSDLIFDEMVKEYNNIPDEYFSELIGTDITNCSDGIFVITIYAKDKIMLEKMVDIVCTGISDYENVMREKFGDHTIELTDTVTCKTVDLIINTNQINNNSKLYTLSTAISSIKAIYVGAESDYLDLLINDYHPYRAPIAQYVIVGALVGAVIAFALLVICVIAKGTLKNRNELSSHFGIVELGFVKENAESLKYIATRVSSYFNDENNKMIAVFSSTEKDYSELISNLNKEIGRELLYQINNPINDVDGYNNVMNSKNIILIEKIGESKYHNILRLLDFCKQNDVNIIGSIIID